MKSKTKNIPKSKLKKICFEMNCNCSDPGNYKCGKLQAECERRIKDSGMQIIPKYAVECRLESCQYSGFFIDLTGEKQISLGNGR